MRSSGRVLRAFSLNSSNFLTSKPKIIKKKQVSSTRVVRVAIKHSITDLSVTKCGITPFKGIRERFKCGILDLRNICLCNPESWPLESGIQLQDSGIPLTIGIRNPNSTGKSRIHGVEVSLGFPYIVRVGKGAVGLTYFSSKKTRIKPC